GRTDRVAHWISQPELRGIVESPRSHRVLPEQVDGAIEKILRPKGHVMLRPNRNRQVLSQLERSLVELVALRRSFGSCDHCKARCTCHSVEPAHGDLWERDGYRSEVVRSSEVQQEPVENTARKNGQNFRHR